MWQAPNARVRAAANAKKRDKERSRRPIHIKRAIAQVKAVTLNAPEGEKIEARVVLNDLSPKGVGLYTKLPLVPTQEVMVEMQDPGPITLKGRVLWCQHDANSHVVSVQAHSYRIGIEFITTSEDEQKAIQAFCDEVFKNHVFTGRTAA
jgi:hypothetical protein